MTNDIQHPQAQATDAQDARYTIDTEAGDPAFASFEIPKGLHPNTATLVRDFAEAMAKKLRASEIKYGWTASWMRKGWRDGLAVELLRHVQKGDPIDVAAYCAFAWFHGWSVAPSPQPHQPDAALVEALKELAEYASYAEIVGGVSVNRPQIRKWCDKAFAAIRAHQEASDAREQATVRAEFDALTEDAQSGQAEGDRS